MRKGSFCNNAKNPTNPVRNNKYKNKLIKKALSNPENIIKILRASHKGEDTAESPGSFRQHTETEASNSPILNYFSP